MSEYKDRRKAEPWENWLVIAAIIVLFILILVCGTGCCAQREIIRRQTDTLYVEKVQVDSIYKRDSVMVREKGDTVYIYKEKIRDRYRLLRDTIRVVKTDTVQTIKEVRVEKPLTWSQTVKQDAFWWLVGGLILSLLWIFRKPIINLLKI